MVKKANAAHFGVPLFLARLTEQGSFMEFALHFLEKCATLNRTKPWSAGTV